MKHSQPASLVVSIWLLIANQLIRKPARTNNKMHPVTIHPSNSQQFELWIKMLKIIRRQRGVLHPKRHRGKEILPKTEASSKWKASKQSLPAVTRNSSKTSPAKETNWQCNFWRNLDFNSQLRKTYPNVSKPFISYLITYWKESQKNGSPPSPIIRHLWHHPSPWAHGTSSRLKKCLSFYHKQRDVKGLFRKRWRIDFWEGNDGIKFWLLG